MNRLFGGHTKKKITAIVVVLAMILLVGTQLSRDSEFITIIDQNIPLGNLVESVAIETNWAFDSSDWELTYEDDFNSSNGTVDTSKWDVQEYNRRDNANGPDGWWLKDKVYQQNGHLVIELAKIGNRNDDDDPFDYGTGMVRSRGQFEQTYGKYEIRCKLPSEAGWWASFWLMSDGVVSVDGTGTDGAEIDVFEGFGWTDTVYHTVHWDGYGGDHQSVYNLTQLDNRDDFHTYTLIWTPTEYQYYVDGILVWVTKGGGVSAVPQYIKISGECSTYGWFATKDWAGDPETANLPDQFLIDYVRVYRYNSTTVPETTVPETTVPETTVPETTVPETTVPGTMVPETTVPETTEPGTMAPETTEPETTEPETSAPETTVPETTAEVPETTTEGQSIVADRMVDSEERIKTKRDVISEFEANHNVPEPTIAEKPAVSISESQALVINDISHTEDHSRNQVTFNVDADGEGVRYSYYIIRDGHTVNHTPYLTRNSYTLDVERGVSYQLLVYALDKHNHSQHRYSDTVLIDQVQLGIDSIDYAFSSDKRHLTFSTIATGEGLRYSYYIIENGRTINYTRYRPDNSYRVDIKPGTTYQVLVYVLDKYQQAVYAYSDSVYVED